MPSKCEFEVFKAMYHKFLLIITQIIDRDTVSLHRLKTQKAMTLIIKITLYYSLIKIISFRSISQVLETHICQEFIC